MSQYYQSVECNGNLFKISALFVDHTLDLTIFENQTAWNVKISKDELANQSTNHCASFNEYYSSLKTYIDSRPKDVEFGFDNGKFVINLVLKNKMRIIYFTTGLIKVDFINSIFSLVDILYDKKVEYYNKYIDIQSQHTSIRNAHDIMNEKLKEFIERKKSDEQKLCNNFIQILNEKKRQILHLNDLLIAFRQGRPTVNPPVQVKRKNSYQKMTNRQKNSKRTPQTSSGSEADDDVHDDDNYETDDEPPNSKNVANIGQNVPSKETDDLLAVPSTSKIKDDEFTNRSLSNLATEPNPFPRRIRSNSHIKFEPVSLKKENAVTKEAKESKIDHLRNSSDQQLPTVNFDTQLLLDNIP